MQASYLSNFEPNIRKRALVSVKDPGNSKLLYFYIFDVMYLTSKEYYWKIKKKYSDFQDLAKKLEKDVANGNLSQCPVLPSGDFFTSSSNENKLTLLESYLKVLERTKEICKNPHFLEFIEVSVLSFDGTSSKRKEGYVMKRTGGHINNEKMCCNISKHFKRMQRRWIIIKDNMIGYLGSHTKEYLHEVLIFKGKFEISHGNEATGFDDGVLITTSRRHFLFRAGDIITRNEWVESISEAYEQSEWRNADVRFDSSFPPRLHNEVKWFVDGLNYFHEVMDCLSQAKNEVLISDWWLSPEMFLKRPSESNPGSQIVEVLGSLADRGVKIYVHVYKEVTLALTLNSLHTKKSLIQRNENIKVVRHPHRSVVGSQFLWSHHEKIVSIDQSVAFIGGLDLCFGRMDTSEHLLTDLESPYVWNGIDYSNVRVADFFDVQDWDRDIIDRETTPRMPWHDVGIKAVGKVACDIALHFIELWNHVMTDISGDYHKNKNLLQPKRKDTETELTNFDTLIEYPPITGVDERFQHKSLRKEWSKSLQEARKLSMLSNMSFHKRIDAYALDKMIEIDDFISNALRVSKQFPLPRLEIEGPKKDFVTRERNQSTVYVTRKGNFEDEDTLDEMCFKNELDADFAQGDETWAKNLLLPKFQKLKKTGSCSCQVVRSAGPWSLGLENAEHSIHAAYLHLIDEANHFIYIENQFFMSNTAGSPVKNQIVQALVERIKIAASLHEPFKVIVMMPLLPGFEGKIQDSPLIKVQLHWEYSTISRGLTSLFEQLSQDPNIHNPEDYIHFVSLRNHAVLNNKPITEIVYVHSKLMIVDDDYVIIGSANINDRSLMGKRDSEIALVINDDNKVDSVLAGRKVKVSEFAHSLRMQLFKEFLGNGDEELLTDPLSDRFTSYWLTTAQNNTALYRHIFRCYPDDKIARLDQIDEYENQAELNEYYNLKDGFKGMLVLFPLNFLIEENLRISIFNKEYILPDENFV